MEKIVIAPDSFKGSLSSAEVAGALAAGVRDALTDAEIVCVPVADGGEGTVEMLVGARNGVFVSREVAGPLGAPVKATYGIIEDDGRPTAVLEMAQASGLPLLAESERDPLRTSTRGTGELIADAYDRGCRSFIIGIGGSATNDGGSGMLRALGVRFLDADGNPLPEGGAALASLARIDLTDARTDILGCPFTVMCDVDNPLAGPIGASAVFGPQKGASPRDVELLDRALARYGDILSRLCGKDVAGAPGAGAAGGMGAAFMAFFNSRLCPGIETALEAVRFSSIIEGASLIITGEGRIDSQTLRGKAPSGVLAEGRRRDIPVIAVGGAVDDVGDVCRAGFMAAVCIQQRALPLAEAMKPATAAAALRATASQIMRIRFDIQHR